MQDLAEEWHQNLIESAAEASEELMEKYLGGEEPVSYTHLDVYKRQDEVRHDRHSQP